MGVSTLRDFLKIEQRIKNVVNGRVANPEKTLVYYWLKNAGNGEHFSNKDIVFEFFHNLVALSQLGGMMIGSPWAHLAKLNRLTRSRTRSRRRSVTVLLNTGVISPAAPDG